MGILLASLPLVMANSVLLVMSVVLSIACVPPLEQAAQRAMVHLLVPSYIMALMAQQAARVPQFDLLTVRLRKLLRNVISIPPTLMSLCAPIPTIARSIVPTPSNGQVFVLLV